MRSEQEVNRAIKLYSDTVKRICVVRLKDYDDTQDIFQNVFMKYALSSACFDSPEHEKAWFIRVTINACNDWFKDFFRSNKVSLDEIAETAVSDDKDTSYVLREVLSLPQKYRDVVYLHFYEGYTAPEISKILKKNVNTIYTLITRSKEMLKERLKDYE
jgi:RNA polymerase sigma-70 factor (ECF subfamily)